MRDSLITVLIVARNAAATIERAVRSVVSQSQARVLLVDDFSTDQTGFLALNAGRGQCEVIRPSLHLALGCARGFGLSKVTTKYTILLDADDAYLPGRIDRAIEQLEQSGAQIWADGLRLRDGLSGMHLKDIPVPTFLKASPSPYRLFERNYLPGVGQVAFLTSLAQQAGYDDTLHGAEDIDIVLRMVASGAVIAYDDAIGYEMFAYPESVSRNLDNQLAMYARVLRKFPLCFIRQFYLHRGSDLTTAIWACHSISMYCGYYSTSLDLLGELDACIPVSEHTYIHEPDGPNPYPERWRRSFSRGTALLLQDESRTATELLVLACSLSGRPESLNNLGVAYRRAGLERSAIKSFEIAHSLCNNFLDAKINLNVATSQRITRLPLRSLGSRCSYNHS